MRASSDAWICGWFDGRRVALADSDAHLTVFLQLASTVGACAQEQESAARRRAGDRPVRISTSVASPQPGKRRRRRRDPCLPISASIRIRRANRDPQRSPATSNVSPRTPRMPTSPCSTIPATASKPAAEFPRSGRRRSFLPRRRRRKTRPGLGADREAEGDGSGRDRHARRLPRQSLPARQPVACGTRRRTCRGRHHRAQRDARRGQPQIQCPVDPCEENGRHGDLVRGRAGQGSRSRRRRWAATAPTPPRCFADLSAMAGEEFGTVMRMVGEEVYLKTGGRQRPWINESLRRLLYFGDAPAAAEGPEGDILRERRQLLDHHFRLARPRAPQRRKNRRRRGRRAHGCHLRHAEGAWRGRPEGSGATGGAARAADGTHPQDAGGARDDPERPIPRSRASPNFADQAISEGALETAGKAERRGQGAVAEIEQVRSPMPRADIKARRLEFAEVYACSARPPS